MSSFVIKLIAIISMLLDHSSDVLIGHLSVLNMIGRIAFPLFAWQLSIGYNHTHSRKKYAIRLIGFALISQIPFSFFSHIISGTYFNLNIFFTLFMGLCAITVFDLKCNKNLLTLLIKIIMIAGLACIGQALKMDYGAYGILLIVAIHCYNKYKNKLWLISSFIIWILLTYIPFINTISYPYLIALSVFSIIPIIIILLYNGKKGPSFKYFFYAFYPLHIAILDLLYYFILN